MTVFNLILAFLSAGMFFYGLYFLIEVFMIHKKIADKHFYFAGACLIFSVFVLFELLLCSEGLFTNYIFLHRLKWFTVVIYAPFFMFTIYECFFPNGKKIAPKIFLYISPFFTILSLTDLFIYGPEKIIKVYFFNIPVFYHFGQSGVMYFIYSLIMYSLALFSAIYFLLSKKEGKRLSFIIIIICWLISAINDMLVAGGYYKNILLIEFLFTASFSFIFFDFLAENKKIHLSVVKLKDEAIHRLKIMEIYTRRSLVESIEKGDDPTKYPPKNIYIAALFSDIRDFTGLSEGMTPLGVVGMLNSYFDSMNATIIKYKGEIDKLMGDCIMALFKKPDDALKAAIEMRVELARFNTSPHPDPPHWGGNPTPLSVWRGDGGEVKRGINNGIGLNYGEVIIGNIGSESKMDYTVVGDIVNTASRLEALTKYYKVHLIISEEFMNQLSKSSEGYKIRFLDEVLVKGKSNPMKIYEVFDFEPPEIIQMKERNVQPFAEAFVLYQAGEFLQAIKIYEKVGQASLLVNNDNKEVGQASLPVNNEHKPVGQASLIVNNEDKTAGQASLLVNNNEKMDENSQSGMIDLPSPDPILPFFISRCRKLQEQKEAGLLKDWSGVFEFMDK